MNAIILGKKFANAEYSAFSKEFEINGKAPKCKVVARLRITKYKNSLAKVSLECGPEKYLQLILRIKLILGRIKVKI